MMRLVNNTGLAASAKLVRQPQRAEDDRVLLVTAKATFGFDPRGRVQLDNQSPYPLFDVQEPMPFGLLPRDDLFRAQPELEVILLGQAHAPPGQATRQRHVSLRVGDVKRELVVSGDRLWSTHKEISHPEPFMTMPLSYDRAFGGTFDIFVDVESRMRVSDPINSLGRGMDLERLMHDFGEALRAPAGYPKLPGYVRQLPNVEHPDRLIEHWDDAPLPAGWATLPMDSGIRQRWLFDRLEAEQPISQEEIFEHTFRQAHPDWVIPMPANLPLVELVGVVPSAEHVMFLLPDVLPVVDVLDGTTTTAHALNPRMLVLLPEELRFYLVYQSVSRLQYVPGRERGARLRSEHGWSPELGPSTTTNG